MSAPTDLQAVMGGTAVGPDGDKIGKIGQLYLDDASGDPVWVTVSTGMFGSNESFAPVYGSSVDGNILHLAVPKAMVKDAPRVDADGHLEDDENDALYEYYDGYLGQARSTATPPVSGGQAGRHAGDSREDLSGKAGIVGQDTSGPTTDDAMTRSEERLHVGTERVEAGRAKLRKYIVEENVSTTVPVSHEEIRVVREPITDANVSDAMAGSDLSEEEHEVTLHAERPVVSKETVPVERVKLDTETVTEQTRVDETVRKEQIDQVEVHGDVQGTTPTDRR